MPIARLQVPHAALLVIDVQDKLMPTIGESGRIINNCAILLKMAGELGIPYLTTEHYPQGLGRTVQPLAKAMLDPAARIEKTRFSGVVDLLQELLDSWGRRTILICGVETHVCVLQTVLDLQASGRQCFVVSDAIGASQPDQIQHALRRMEAAGAVTTGVLSAMYELLVDASHPARRACVALAKQIQL